MTSLTESRAITPSANVSALSRAIDSLSRIEKTDVARPAIPPSMFAGETLERKDAASAAQSVSSMAASKAFLPLAMRPATSLQTCAEFAAAMASSTWIATGSPVAAAALTASAGESPSASALMLSRVHVGIPASSAAYVSAVKMSPSNRGVYSLNARLAAFRSFKSVPVLLLVSKPNRAVRAASWPPAS
eukprot:6159960-Prymnesium_polylepis.3